MPTSPRRRADKRRKSSTDSEEMSLNTQEDNRPTTMVDNKTASSATDTLDQAASSLPESIKTLMVKSTLAMLKSHEETDKRFDSLQRISETDEQGNYKIGSISSKEGGPSPVTCSKILKDDDEAKKIISDDLELTAEFNKAKAKLIIRMAKREYDIRKGMLRELMYDVLMKLATALTYKNKVLKVGKRSQDKIDAEITDKRMAHAAVRIFCEDLDVATVKRLFHENGRDFASRYSTFHTASPSETIKQKLQEATVQAIVLETSEELDYFFPLMTIPFWDERDMEKTIQEIDQHVTATIAADNQESANADVAMELDRQGGDAQAPMNVMEAMKEPFQRMIDKSINANEQKKKGRARKKSSANRVKQNQPGGPEKNGRNGSRKSKKNQNKSQQSLNELLEKQQQNGSAKKRGNNQDTSEGRGAGGGGGRSNHQGRGGRGGRGKRGNRGGSNNGGGRGNNQGASNGGN